ncbi:MAG TPA: type II toxin-antitoxin system VapC family toxin [Chloroflexota bacterium]|nr:type II toxin-antitoxin system VapC family toxin [Chloroflexota bacterium]
MTIPDLNVLLYAVNAESPHHPEARRWLGSALDGRDAVGFPWAVLLGFMRLSTRELIFPRPLSADEAVSVVETWLNSPSSIPIEPTPRHLSVLAELLRVRGAAGNTTTDAHLAALAIEHKAEVATFDHGFGRFPGVRVAILG